MLSAAEIKALKPDDIVCVFLSHAGKQHWVDAIVLESKPHKSPKSKSHILATVLVCFPALPVAPHQEILTAQSQVRRPALCAQYCSIMLLREVDELLQQTRIHAIRADG